MPNRRNMSICHILYDFVKCVVISVLMYVWEKNAVVAKFATTQNENFQLKGNRCKI